MRDNGHFEKDEVPFKRENHGHYCAWGVWHDVNEKCRHFATTGVPPEHMRRLRKEMYPDWLKHLDGSSWNKRPTDAMTNTMQKAIIARYCKERDAQVR